jgi:hypothetical protein
MPLFVEPILLEPIAQPEFSAEFCLVCEMAGLHTPSEILEHHSRDLIRLPGFSYRLLYEFVHFLEKNRIAHYLDSEE